MPQKHVAFAASLMQTSGAPCPDGAIDTAKTTVTRWERSCTAEQASCLTRTSSNLCFLFIFSFQWKDLLPLRLTPTIQISKPLMETPKCATLRLDSSCDRTRGPPRHTIQLPKTPLVFFFYYLFLIFFFFFKDKNHCWLWKAVAQGG